MTQLPRSVVIVIGISVALFLGTATFILNELRTIHNFEPPVVHQVTQSGETQPLENVFQPITDDVKFNIRFNTETNPKVRPLERAHQASSAMAAKFRSLSPKKIQIYYDDGRGGVEQGHLSLGQETTTNTYEGHVFFFTEYGNKKNELARYTMSPNQVGSRKFACI